MVVVVAVIVATTGIIVVVVVEDLHKILNFNIKNIKQVLDIFVKLLLLIVLLKLN